MSDEKINLEEPLLQQQVETLKITARKFLYDQTLAVIEIDTNTIVSNTIVSAKKFCDSDKKGDFYPVQLKF